LWGCVMNTSEPTTPDERPPPCPEEIRAQVERIVASPEFPKIGRGTVFLKYVIDEALEGRSSRIKGYSVAVEVFKRSEGFTQDDPVVRIEAGRLRRSLERYYLVAGEHDPIRITIPKGGYVPRFDWMRVQEEEVAADAPLAQSLPSRATLTRFSRGRLAVASGIFVLLLLGAAFAFREYQHVATNLVDNTVPEGPTLAVAPFTDMGEGADAKLYAEGLTEDLLTALPRFKELKVFGRETSRRLSPGANAADVGHETGARYLLGGGVRIDKDKIRVTARLSETATSKILWSATYDEDLGTRSLFAIQTDVANKVATAVAQPYGIISQAVTADAPPDDLDAYGCTIRFYQYLSEVDLQKHGEVRACLLDAVTRYPTYGTAWAMLSIVYLDEERFGFNHRGDGAQGPLQDALEAARKGIQVDPENSRALQALMMSLFFNQQIADGIRIGEQALIANPNDTQLMSEFGTRLAMSGQWERGGRLLREALARNPGAAGYYHAVLGLSAYMQADYQDAVFEIEQADLQKQPLFHIVAAVIYAQVGRKEDAKREGDIFVKMRPNFLPNIRAELTLRNVQPSDQTKLIEGVRKIELQVPPFG
jgi:adenylate cyclase